MTGEQLNALKPGDLVGHADCQELTFKVRKVRTDDDEDGRGVYVYAVETVCVQADGVFEFSMDGDTIVKLTPPPPIMDRPTAYGVVCERVKQIEEMGKKAFAGHVLVNGHRDVSNTDVRSWVIGQPDGSFHMRFRLTVYPGYLLVTGDVGTCVWVRERDMLSWAAGSINSLDYFAEKVPHAISTEQWCGDKAKAWVWEKWAQLTFDALCGDYRQPVRYGVRETKTNAEVLADLKETRDELLARVRDGESAFCSHLYEQTGWVDGCDFPDLEVFNGNFLWCREAVRCGLRLLGYKTND